jgi:hypothetical protein
MALRLCLLAIAVLVPNLASAQFTDFQDLVSGTQYPTGSVFTSNGLNFKVVKFGSFGSGAGVGNFGSAGGSGNEISLGNTAGLEFLLPKTMQSVSMRFGTLCCSTGIVVNGVASPLSGNLNGLNGMTYGGVLVTAAETNNRGQMILTGPINSLVVGGTEFAIDDVRVVPEPSTVMLGLLACMAGACFRRRAAV